MATKKTETTEPTLEEKVAELQKLARNHGWAVNLVPEEPEAE